MRRNAWTALSSLRSQSSSTSRELLVWRKLLREPTLISLRREERLPKPMLLRMLLEPNSGLSTRESTVSEERRLRSKKLLKRLPELLLRNSEDKKKLLRLLRERLKRKKRLLWLLPMLLRPRLKLRNPSTNKRRLKSRRLKMQLLRQKLMKLKLRLKVKPRLKLLLNSKKQTLKPKKKPLPRSTRQREKPFKRKLLRLQRRKLLKPQMLQLLKLPPAQPCHPN